MRWRVEQLIKDNSGLPNRFQAFWQRKAYAYPTKLSILVFLSKFLNEHTGGDAYTKGWIDINPAKVEYLLNGYFGGVVNTLDKLEKAE